MIPDGCLMLESVIELIRAQKFQHSEITNSDHLSNRKEKKNEKKIVAYSNVKTWFPYLWNSFEGGC